MNAYANTLLGERWELNQHIKDIIYILLFTILFFSSEFNKFEEYDFYFEYFYIIIIL